MTYVQLELPQSYLADRIAVSEKTCWSSLRFEQRAIGYMQTELMEVFVYISIPKSFTPRERFKYIGEDAFQAINTLVLKLDAAMREV